MHNAWTSGNDQPMKDGGRGRGDPQHKTIWPRCYHRIIFFILSVPLSGNTITKTTFTRIFHKNRVKLKG